jgi:predicted nucleic acid-binding protein
MMRVVVDTNVLVSALKSRLGWSFEVLRLMGTGRFAHVVTVPLMIEYADVLGRSGMVPVDQRFIEDVLDFVATSAVRRKVHFLWRPRLTDAKDDMVLEAAVNGQCRYIVTHNVRDFSLGGALGIQAITPAQFMQQLQENPP